jgi:hypothetical protein
VSNARIETTACFGRYRVDGMVRCTVCRHTARARPPELRQMFPYPLRLQTAAHLLRCSECGAKGQVHIAPVPAQAR